MILRTAILMLLAAVFAAYNSAAAPTISAEGKLLRPSPINPDIPMDPKPAETITKIIDPIEAAEFMHNIDQQQHSTLLSGPTPAPVASATTHHKTASVQSHELTVAGGDSVANKILNRQKRVDQPSAEITSSTTASSTTQATPLAAPDNSEKDEDKNNKQADGGNAEPALHTVPLIHRQPFAGASQADYIQHKRPEDISEIATASAQLVTPLQQQPRIAEHSVRRRDIPVPLVPKYHHPEESPKSDEKKDEDQAVTPKSEKKPSEEDDNKGMLADDHKAKLSDNLAAKHNAESKAEDSHLHSSNVHGEHQSTTSNIKNTIGSTSSSSATQDASSEPSVMRHRPKPVAELFGRLKQAEEKHGHQQNQDEQAKQQQHESGQHEEKKKKHDDSKSSEEDKD